MREASEENRVSFSVPSVFHADYSHAADGKLDPHAKAAPRRGAAGERIREKREA